eukprot:6937043-Prymnesium_polylepis.1
MLVGSVCVGFSVVLQTLILISLLAERRGVRSAAETGTQISDGSHGATVTSISGPPDGRNTGCLASLTSA